MENKFKSVGLWGSYDLKQGNPLQIFCKHWSNCICFVHFSIFDLLYQRGYQRQYFWALNLKVLAYEAATAWNRGIPCKILTFLIILYLVLLNGSKRLSEVRYFEIEWICRPIRQIQPETGESLVFFKTLIQLYLFRSFPYSLTYCIKEVIKSKIFWRLNSKVLAYEAATAWNRGIPCTILTYLIKLYLFLLNG